MKDFTEGVLYTLLAIAILCLLAYFGIFSFLFSGSEWESRYRELEIEHKQNINDYNNLVDEYNLFKRQALDYENRVHEYETRCQNLANQCQTIAYNYESCSKQVGQQDQLAQLLKLLALFI